MMGTDFLGALESSSIKSGRCELMKIYPPLTLDEYIVSNSKGPRYILHQHGESFSDNELSDDHIS